MNQLDQLLKNASPRPWNWEKINKDTDIQISGEKKYIAFLNKYGNHKEECNKFDEATASLITLAVNHFEEMLEVLKLAKKGLDDPDDDYFSAIELEDKLDAILSKLEAGK